MAKNRTVTLCGPGRWGGVGEGGEGENSPVEEELGSRV